MDSRFSKDYLKKFLNNRRMVRVILNTIVRESFRHQLMLIVHYLHFRLHHVHFDDLFKFEFEHIT
jgi:hypothetical protein